MQFLEVIALVLVAGTLTFALAHAAELPGKLRLDRQTYAAVQPIYYPGFTVGAFSEPGSIVVLVVLLVLTPLQRAAFGWIAAALAAIVAMHLVYWLVTHPVNRFWLKDQKLTGASQTFFSIGETRNAATAAEPRDWTALRDRWEYSHVARAALALLGLIFLAIAVTLPERPSP